MKIKMMKYTKHLEHLEECFVSWHMVDKNYTTLPVAVVAIVERMLIVARERETFPLSMSPGRLWTSENHWFSSRSHKSDLCSKSEDLDIFAAAHTHYSLETSALALVLGSSPVPL
jgi:hypothetical protein